MSTGELLQYMPFLAVSLAVVLLCFYHYSKKRRGSYDITAPPLCTAQPEDGEEMVVFYNRAPPEYRSIELPPPYSQFDPKLTVWLGGAPPPYEMYPLSQSVAPDLWTSTSPSTSHS